MASTVTTQSTNQGARLSDRAYRELRRMIVDGELQQGKRLTERGLAELLEISPTPIREALQRLEHEWLIERRGPRTVVVAGANRRRLRELRVLEAALRGVGPEYPMQWAQDHAEIVDAQALRTVRYRRAVCSEHLCSSWRLRAS